MSDTATFRATEELWRLAEFIMAYVVCEDSDCAECNLLRGIARSVLGIKKRMHGPDDRG